MRPVLWKNTLEEHKNRGKNVVAENEICCDIKEDFESPSKMKKISKFSVYFRDMLYTLYITGTAQ